MMAGNQEAIDRRSLVRRHNPIVRTPDPLSPLTVGNGEFAFTADITGLQSFPDAYLGEGRPDLPGVIPLGTQSQWGWHSFPDPHGYRLEDALADYDTFGRPVSYPYARSPLSGEQSAAINWLRQNPHRLHLGRVGLDLRRQDGSRLKLADLESPTQTLDLWTGTLDSRFRVEGEAVHVQTRCHPQRDMIAVRVESPLWHRGRLRIALSFPYGSDAHTAEGADWDHPECHETRLTQRDAHRVDFGRTLDADGYHVALQSRQALSITQVGKHEFLLTGSDSGNNIEFVVAFAPEPLPASLPTVSECEAASAAHWGAFWQSGGAIELAGSRDPRARELERRIVLSQYLTAIQCAGSLPPQETGLTFNSWYGKFHLEMHWWHAAHFGVWGRIALLEKSLLWYGRILPLAQETARRQGYKGARWPKMVGPEGHESPSNIGPFLIWQQPHPIYYAELAYRAAPSRETLERYQAVVAETAEFMASYAYWRVDQGRYVLGPPLIPAQERFPAEHTFNPTFELEYWRWGLVTAQRWRERLGLPREQKWDDVIAHLAPLPMANGVYVNAESHPDTFDPGGQRTDHPSLLGACGILPGLMADREAMRRTLHKVFETWTWSETWGWDYPMTAMAAARAGEPGLAVGALLMDAQHNTYLPNGHNYNRVGLTIYLPGNGGLLMAAAMMAAGWDGAPDIHAPGFPQDGAWDVRWEGLSKMP